MMLSKLHPLKGRPRLGVCQRPLELVGYLTVTALLFRSRPHWQLLITMATCNMNTTQNHVVGTGTLAPS